MYFLQNLIIPNSALPHYLEEEEYVLLKFYLNIKCFFCLYRSFSFDDTCINASKLLNLAQSRRPKSSLSQGFYVIKRFHSGVLYPVTPFGSIFWELAEDPESQRKQFSYFSNFKQRINKSSLTHYIVLTDGDFEIDSRYFNFACLDNPSTRIFGNEFALSFLISEDEEEEYELEESVNEPKVCQDSQELSQQVSLRMLIN